jgi:hypothetical protein
MSIEPLGSHAVTVLAATVHDPIGRLREALPQLAAPLRDVFAGIALNVSDTTDAEVVRQLHEIGAVAIHPTGVPTVGRARRDAVAAARAIPADQIIYSDFDHMARWIEGDAAELSTVLSVEPQTDCLIVGRSAQAFAAEPARLRETETLVNRIYAMMTGRHADLMFAVRRLSRRAADLIVAQSREDTLASDADWPLLCEGAGLAVGYAESNALYYRTMDEFGAPADTGDGDPENWIARVEFAALHATAMRAYIKR